ncbi:acyltransferase family protein [Propionicicella superfundia]|uniref:acyltransferase family protein n=1 Tax=Propionicicella superfundia TaxID=348582 RepID=UPI00041630A5|nr:acyltransferase [Propionicicella superfundia]
MSQPVLSATPRVGSEDRNAYVDWARAVSVCVVVAFHSRLYTLTRVDGRLDLSMWDPPEYLWIVSWPLMAIPVFFLAGGYGHSVNMVKAARLGTGYGAFLAARGRRLVGPTTAFVGVCALIASVLALVAGVQAIAPLSQAGMNLLWFITVYMGVTAAAPAMVRLQDRHGVAVLIVLAALAAGVDAAAALAHQPELRNLNLAPVWLFAHQLGIAYHRGWFRTWSGRRLLAVAAASLLVILALVQGLGYPPVSVGIGSIPIANVLPPTFAMVPLALAQACALAAFEKKAPRWALSPRARRPVVAINALLMTIYLWHVPCIVVVNGLAWLSGVADRLPPSALHVVVSVTSLLLVAVVVPLMGRLDLAMVPPLGARQSTGLAVLATAVSTLGVALVWRTGVVVHPAAPWSTLGVLTVGVGWVLMRRAARAG